MTALILCKRDRAICYPLGIPCTAMTMRLPTSTYRFQFNYRFTLKEASTLIDYLSDLGISDCYASPLTLARPRSLHGYDVTDHSKVNPEIGGEGELIEFRRGLP